MILECNRCYTLNEFFVHIFILYLSNIQHRACLSDLHMHTLVTLRTATHTLALVAAYSTIRQHPLLILIAFSVDGPERALIIRILTYWQ
jgi:hypothetical protein